MRIEHLEYLIEVDKLGSISAAAQELYLSQATLSNIIKGLEEELGFPVFERLHNGVHTTAEGEEALAIIWEILALCREAKQLGVHTSSSQPVPVLLSPTTNAALSLPLNRNFLEQAPDGNIEFRVMEGSEIGNQIITGESSIGITYFTRNTVEDYQNIASKYQVEVEFLCRDTLCLLVRKDHPLAALDEVSAGDLDGLDFAILGHFSRQEDSIAYAPSLGLDNRYTTFPSVTQIQRAVARQNMVSILSAYTIQHSPILPQDHFKAIRLVNTRMENSMSMYLLHRSEENLRPLEKVLIQCVRSLFEPGED